VLEYSMIRCGILSHHILVPHGKFFFQYSMMWHGIILKDSYMLMLMCSPIQLLMLLHIIPNLHPKMCIQSNCNLLPLLMDSIVISHIFPHLPATTPSIVWHIWQINKAWFMVIAKNVFWNASEMVRVDHRPYLVLLLKLVVQGYVFKNVLSKS